MNPDSNALSLFLIGCSHKSADIAQRERLALSHQVIASVCRPETLREARIAEAMVVQTCNRLEFYGVAPATVEPEQLPACFKQLDCFAFTRLAYRSTEADVVKHLFSVASGLDSQMLGETEILGQIKEAYSVANSCKTVGPALHRLLQKTFQVAKWTRTNTGISRGQTTIGNVAVDLAERVCGELSEANILLLGTGEVGSKTAQAIMSRGPTRLTIASRTFESARLLADSFKGAAVVPFEHFHQQIEVSDVVISCTRSPAPLLTTKRIAEAMLQRPSRPLTLIDLAVPRDVDPDVGGLDNVYLFNMDDLARTANENLKAREREVATAHAAIETRAEAAWKEIARRLRSRPLHLCRPESAATNLPLTEFQPANRHKSPTLD